MAYTTLESPSRGNGLTDADSKTINHMLDTLATERTKRSRHYRDLGPSAVAKGVAAAKQTAALKAISPNINLPPLSR
jgi:hypothetical protein